MLWILLALLAHTANGVVFIVDKSLLGGKGALGKPLTYALYSAGLAVCSLVLLPFASITPTSFILVWGLVAGIVHIVALYVFFSAMRLGEPSRVVPITGSAVPAFTILFAVYFLGEVFTVLQGVGMALLVAGGALLANVSFPRMRESTAKKKRGYPIRSGMTIMLPLLAGGLFAIYFVITKHIYTYAGHEFLDVFMTTRVIEGIIALIGVAVFIGVPFSPGGEKARMRGIARRGLPSFGSVIFVLNKVLAAGAFLLQTYAVSLGSVSVVNALQGVQYAAVFVLALIISRYYPKLFVEETSRQAVVQKMAGMLLMIFGVALVVL